MEFTWGFLALFVLFIVPGLIVRRLYYYGEFSKQFQSREFIPKTLAYSLLPGIFVAICAYLIVDAFSGIDLGEVVDFYKKISSESQRFKDDDGTSVSELAKDKILPFLGLLYAMSLVLGVVSGRFVRFAGLDTTWKLFRFQNHWFYLFSGDHAKLSKYRFLRKKNKRFLFTQADILIGSGSGTNLYTGIIVDYELKPDNSHELSKVILKNAKRYAKEDGITVPRVIPGNLLVVDCSNMLNINLTYIYGETTEFLKSVWPKIISYGSILPVFLLLPFFIYQMDWISWKWYHTYFEYHWTAKIFFYLFVTQIPYLLNPFRQKSNGEMEFIPFKMHLYKIGLTLAFYGLTKGITALFS